MEATTVIAGYGAVVSTVALSWQIIREIRKRRPSVRVAIEHGAAPVPSIMTTGSGPERLLDYSINVVVVNEGENTEYVRELSIEDADRNYGYDFLPSSRSDRELPPRARIAESVLLSALDVGSLDRGFVARVQLASGAVRESQVVSLDDEIASYVFTHNAEHFPHVAPLAWSKDSRLASVQR